ncbi:transcriptional regulator, TetR family [Chitinophaga rupis]|jgi:AcrR family transcriptional regulator|uniref:Transcriptional regulator, TetR family n=1 Tax=Chitinophaga rupis TaxID=573321 RepID=A0A1H7QGL4_9BACT|nr:TetR/AcrR family transcriptional regulator [Chitinophaga rupis]SEL47240.1 transcriptional regulator, TetR family [Chitinophaga rupis]
MEEAIMDYNQKQLQILDTAERLFAMHGFHGASVRDIAQEADVNIAMISYYFGSKERLIEAIFLKRVMDVKNGLDELVKNKDLAPLEKINKLIELFVAKISDRPYFCRIMVRAQATQEGVPTELIHEVKKQMYDLVKKLITEGQKKGAFLGDIDTMMMVNTLVGTSNHVIISQNFLKKVWNQEAISEEKFRQQLKERVSNHLKKLFKVVLTDER